MKQIDKSSSSYKYYTGDFQGHRKNHFMSIFYQAQIPINLEDCYSMLEFGTGRNTTKALVEHFGLNHKSVDFDNIRFNPDEVSTILDYTDKNQYDLVAAFQVLEHNPIETIEPHLSKLRSFSKKYVYISVPYSGRWFSWMLNINILPSRIFNFSSIFHFVFPRKFLKKTRPTEEFQKREDKHNPHWWEVGDKNLSVKNFEKIIELTGLSINKKFHNEFFPYHIFYLLEIKIKDDE